MSDVELDIGGSLIACRNLAEAQNKYCDERDAHEACVGPSGARFPEAIVRVGSSVYRVAYNGSVWANGRKVAS